MAMAIAHTIERSEEVQRCIDECLTCHSILLETAVEHCLRMGGKHAAQDHMRMMLDCSDICRVSADFMLRGSKFSARICDICAQINDRCAESCDQFVGDDKMMACSDQCRRTADSCREMVRMSR
ncbi:hypothetical protein ANME2D_02708 [Candidatus Methanoperedens nitroreducens]|uniref:Ferredoxin n=1 Tax=Candidatus Methanoperedens nitratireducens TaxID=1392998 RepID=A0A062V5K0_9EURY|nr:four-helix bundle copper-binding protein [Candidatus Methanoperedens nitroreducens]KCZ70685.1 hypothetical protein ANME2D_02708 [Candidatus Methanoperedens nitroreducens]MDJ1420538.1 four-helix bundle copper-binding protein [Candidatus Methanoperedens sp.]